MNTGKNIVSISRRTDIPRFYAKWFAERRKAGWAEYRNSFGGKGSVSLLDKDVLGFLLWTRDAGPFRNALRGLLAAGLPCVFQYTITGYDRAIEPFRPPRDRAVEDFRATGAMLPDPACIQWRYDPIVISEKQPVSWHLENFEIIAAALQGATWVVNTSIVEPYAKAIRRMGDPTTVFRTVDNNRHQSVMKRYPGLGQPDYDRTRRFLSALADIASGYGMELRLCANPEWDLPASQCCGAEIFSPYGVEVRQRLETMAPRPTRAACRCLPSVDIGMDNTCVSGCKYCYVVTSHELAARNYRLHQPAVPTLR